MTPITEIPLSTRLDDFPVELDELFAQVPSDTVVADLLEMVGESPEALRGVLIGFASALTCMKVAMEHDPGIDATSVALMLTAALWGLEHTPQYDAAVAILEGGRS